MIRVVLAAAALAAMMAATEKAQGLVTCISDAAGASGDIYSRSDVVSALNCLGQQIASASNRAASRKAFESQQEQIRELQDAYNDVNRRLFLLEANRK